DRAGRRHLLAQRLEDAPLVALQFRAHPGAPLPGTDVLREFAQMPYDVVDLGPRGRRGSGPVAAGVGAVR
ncbi:hypothetical protein, partial [Streptomyces sp. NPDC057052]|uniref:hypothetical protein n=1 Tax=Streptomyces sp. NPDC057052 TaxID=3346010 RepID=UPI00362EBCA3